MGTTEDTLTNMYTCHNSSTLHKMSLKRTDEHRHCYEAHLHAPSKLVNSKM